MVGPADLQRVAMQALQGRVDPEAGRVTELEGIIARMRAADCLSMPTLPKADALWLLKLNFSASLHRRCRAGWTWK